LSNYRSGIRCGEAVPLGRPSGAPPTGTRTSSSYVSVFWSMSGEATSNLPMALLELEARLWNRLEKPP